MDRVNLLLKSKTAELLLLFDMLMYTSYL